MKRLLGTAKRQVGSGPTSSQSGGAIPGLPDLLSHLPLAVAVDPDGIPVRSFWQGLLYEEGVNAVPQGNRSAYEKPPFPGG